MASAFERYSQEFHVDAALCTKTCTKVLALVVTNRLHSSVMPFNAVALKKHRERRGWTQQELADRAGLHRVSVARLESGARTAIAVGVLEKLAAALRVPLSALLKPTRRENR